MPEYAFDDVVVDILDPLIAQLAVAQSGNCIVFIQTLLRFGGGFDVPLQQRHVQRRSDFLGQHGFARSGLAFDEKRALEGDGGVNGQHQIGRCNVALGALEFHGESGLKGLGRDARSYNSQQFDFYQNLQRIQRTSILYAK